MSSLLHLLPRVRGVLALSLAVTLFTVAPGPAHAQSSASTSPGAPATADSGPQQPVPTLTCASTNGERRHCEADTSAGVTLIRSTGAATCTLGRTWGYDATGVWVSDGCAGEFLTGSAAAQSVQTTPAESRKPTERIETWGEFDPGDGFLVGRGDAGELAISAYALLRYVNQTPGTQTFSDHLGNERTVDGRNDIHPHRIIVYLKGWLGTPKLIYTVFFWTVNTTDQDALFGVMGYQFSRKFSLYAGINGTPGTRSMQGSHPYWLGHDRMMADEFFRPYFAYGTWASGEITPGLWYNAMVGNNSSSLGIKATQLDRRLSSGASMFWMPTTKEFGPKGAYGDWEHHEKLATRFGFSTAQSPEERFTDANTGSTGNTVIKLADSLNLFDVGALAPGVTVSEVDYRILSFDAGMKYRGIFLQTEIYTRWLDNFVADGTLPVSEIVDQGFYLQGAFYPIKKKLELYAGTSQIFGDKDAGFGDSSEYVFGANFYPVNTRNHRLNVQIQDVNRSPVSSTFGYFVGGHTGQVYSAAFSILF
jgi:hypothetical protein